MLPTNAGRFIYDHAPGTRSVFPHKDYEIAKRLRENGLATRIHCSYEADAARIEGRKITYQLSVWSVDGQCEFNREDCRKAAEILGLEETVTVEAPDVIVELGQVYYEEDMGRGVTFRVFYYLSELRQAIRP